MSVKHRMQLQREEIDGKEFQPFVPREVVRHQDGGTLVIDWEWRTPTSHRGQGLLTDSDRAVGGYYIHGDDGFHLHALLGGDVIAEWELGDRLGDYASFDAVRAAARRHAKSTCWIYEDQRR